MIGEDERAGPLRYLVVDTPAYRFYLDEDEQPRLLLAIQEFERGGSGWFVFEHLDGRILHLRLAAIEYFGVSSPETREKFAEMEREQRADEARLKSWDDDD